jgi:hypothetical protein
VGGSKLVPNNNHNPYHKEFPYWLSEKKQTRANSFRPLKATIDIDNGRVVYENVAMDADPHYLSEHQIVVNHLHDSRIYDDDAVDVVDIQNGETTKLSSNDFLAIRHSMDMSGNKKIIAYQQCDTHVSPESVTDDNLDQRSMQLSKHFNICADMLQGDGTWKKYVVYQSDMAKLQELKVSLNNARTDYVDASSTYNSRIVESQMKSYIDSMGIDLNISKQPPYIITTEEK